MIATKETCIRWLHEQPPGTYEVKKKRRTLVQNAYYWSLLSELAGVLRTSNEQLHFEMLKRYSTVTAWATLDTVDLSKVYSFRYHEEVNRVEHTVYYRIYTPSEELDTKEFGRLLDGLIDECKQVGINTATPSELARMKEG